MSRNIHRQRHRQRVEVCHHEQHLSTRFTQEDVLALQVTVHVHQVKEDTLLHGLLLTSYLQRLLVNIKQLFLVILQLFVSSTTERVDAPIVEDGGATVPSAESLLIHTTLAIFLASVEHEGVLLHQHRGHHGRHALSGITSKEVAGYALFVVVLQEVEHVLTDVVRLLPGCRDGVRRLMATHHSAHGVVHAHLIIEIVKACTNVVAVFGRIIHLADEDDIRIAILHLVGSPMPEGGRHHLGHITAETVNSLLRPEQEDFRHLIPSVGNRIEVPYSACIVVEAVVQLHRLIPVVHAWRIVEAVVTCSLGRRFVVSLLLSLIQVEVRREMLTGTVVEVVLRVETVVGIVLLAQVLHAQRLADRVVLASHMVGHEVDNHLHASLVRARYKSLKLRHAIVHINRQVGVDVVVVGNGIGRACLSLYHSRMLTGNAVLAVVRLRGVTDDARVPNMAHAHFPDFLQGRGREVVQFSTSILFYRTILLASSVTIAVETGEYLINYYL